MNLKVLCDACAGVKGVTGHCLLQQAGTRLAATASGVRVMGAGVEAINTPTCLTYTGCQFGVNFVEFALRDNPASNAGLVGDHKNWHIQRCEAHKPGQRARQQDKLARRPHVVAPFNIDRAVSVKQNALYHRNSCQSAELCGWTLPVLRVAA